MENDLDDQIYSFNWTGKGVCLTEDSPLQISQFKYSKHFPFL